MRLVHTSTESMFYQQHSVYASQSHPYYLYAYASNIQTFHSMLDSSEIDNINGWDTGDIINK